MRRQALYDLLRRGMEPRACPVCGCVEDHVLVAEQHLDPAALDGFGFASRKLPEYMHYRLVACSVCDVVFANPAPRPEMLAAAYREAAYDSGDEARMAAQTYADLLPSIRARLGTADSALDIGAGDGAFLERLLAAGFTDVAGVEPSEAPRESAPDHLRSLIRSGVFSTEAFAGRSFDLVTCLQTIEHVPDPLPVFRAARDLLRPGGAVLVVCHNRRALSARLLGRRSPIYDIEHLQLFSPRSVRLLLRRAGFEGIEVKPVINRYPVRYWARLFPFPPRVKAEILKRLAGTTGGAVRVPLPAGNIAATGYRRG